MVVEAVRAAPAWSAVAVEQFRRIGVGLRVIGPGIAVVLLVFGAAVLYQYHSDGDAFDWRLNSFLLIVLAAVIPARAWFQNEVERRSYMWSLPVERGRSHLSVIASGWLWLFLVVSVYVAWSVSLYRLTGSMIRTGGPPGFWILPPPTSLVTCAVLYTSATIIYLIASVPLVFARRPIIWVGWGWLAIMFPLRFLRGSDLPIIGFLVDEVFGRGRVGLLTAITGQRNSTSLGMTFETGAWLTAAGFWLVIAMGAVVCAALIHREA